MPPVSCKKFRVSGFVHPTKVSIWESNLIHFCVTQHSNSNNILFYVNAIDNTLKMCLANPDIAANNLVQYPIVSSEFKYVLVVVMWW